MTLSEFFHQHPEKSSYLFREFVWILKEKCRLNEVALLAGTQSLSLEHQNILNSWCEKRKQDYPLQYFIGSTEFYGLNLAVYEGALIPRNETEDIARYVVDWAKGKACKRLLDIGAGTGCLGLGVAANLESINEAHFVEPFLDAQKSLKANLEKYKNLRGWKLINHVKAFEEHEVQGEFDIVLSNPPYIFEGDPDVTSGVYKYEPHEALYGGPQGWEKEVQWVAKAYEHLAPGGLMAFEISHDQRTVLESKLKRFKPKIHKDVFGKDRMLIVIKEV